MLCKIERDPKQRNTQVIKNTRRCSEGIYYDRKLTDGRKNEKPKEKHEKMTTFRLEK